MKVILLTGGIGSGKSAVRGILCGMGLPCYDADSAVKSFYCAPTGDCPPAEETGRPFLLPEIERNLGRAFRTADGSFDSRALAGEIFGNAGKLRVVEGIVFPALAADFAGWLRRIEKSPASGKGLAFFESATALDKPDFPKIWDACLWVDAPEEVRIERVMRRDGCSREQALARIRLQSTMEKHRSEIDSVISNDCPSEELEGRVIEALGSLAPPDFPADD